MKHLLGKSIATLLSFMILIACMCPAMATENNPSTGQELSEELLTNNEFNECLVNLIDNWQMRGEPQASLSIETDVEGAQGNCLKFVPGGKNGWNYVGVIAKDLNTMDLEPDTTYLFSARIKRAGSGTPTAALAMRTSNSAPNQKILLTNDNWTEITFEYHNTQLQQDCQIIAGIAEPATEIGYGKTDPSLAVYIDSVSVKKYVAHSDKVVSLDLSRTKTSYQNNEQSGIIQVTGITETGTKELTGNENVTYTSSAPHVLSVDANGSVTINSSGAAVVTASYTNEDGTTLTGTILIGVSNGVSVHQNFNQLFYDPEVDLHMLQVENRGRDGSSVLKISKPPMIIGITPPSNQWGFDLSGGTSSSQICEGWFYDNGTNLYANSSIFFQSNATANGQAIPITARYQLGIDLDKSSSHYYFISNAEERIQSQTGVDHTGAGTIYTVLDGQNELPEVTRSKGWHQVCLVTHGKDNEWYTDKGTVELYFDGKKIFEENYVHPPIGCVRGNLFYDVPQGSYYDDFSIASYDGYHRPPVVSNVVLNGIAMAQHQLTVTCDITDVDGDDLDTPLYQWEISDDGSTEWIPIAENNAPSFTCPQKFEGKYIRVKVTPRSLRQPTNGYPQYSNVKQIKAWREPPSVSNISLSGSGMVGETLTLTYEYNSSTAPEGETEIVWERNRDSSEWIPISHAKSQTTYQLGLADAGCQIRATITPVDQAGLKGVPLTSPSTISVAKEMAYYVAPDGDNNNCGSKDHPFQNWVSARNAIARDMQQDQLPPGPVYVYLREGVYQAYPQLPLNENYSGTPANPITYCNYPNETVRIINGKSLNVSDAILLSDSMKEDSADQAFYNRLRDPLAKTKVRKINLDLPTPIDPLMDYGFGMKNEFQPVEIFIDGQALELARWPNKNSNPDVLNVTKVAGGDTNTQPFTLTYQDPSNYTQSWSSSDLSDAYIWGKLGSTYSFLNHKIAAFDLANKKITSLYGTTYKPQKYDEIYFYNIPDELDQPGECYIDRAREVLYFYPPCELNESTKMSVSCYKNYMVNMVNAHDISITGIHFDTARNTMIKTYNVKNIEIDSCTFACGASNAITLNGYDSGVYNCHINSMGKGGIIVQGGDRKELIPGNNEIMDNEIHHYNRLYQSSIPGVAVYGVGHIIASNSIHDAPQTAIQLFGTNDTLIEKNEIYNMVQDSADVGAIYLGRKPHELGTTIRYNLFYNIGNSKGGYGQQSIFLDDGSAGALIYGNIFDRPCRTASQSGGPTYDHAIKFNSSQFNLVKNNIFIDAPSTVNFLRWGGALSKEVDWWLWANDKLSVRQSNIRKEMQALGWGSDIWLNHYAGTHWEQLSQMFTEEQYQSIANEENDIMLKYYANQYAPQQTNRMEDNILIDITKEGSGNVGGSIQTSGNVRLDSDAKQQIFANYGSNYIITSWGYGIIKQHIPDFPSLSNPSGIQRRAGGAAPSVSNLSIQGTAAVGSTVHAEYDYYNSDGKREGISTIVWYQSDTKSGDYTKINQSGKELLITQGLSNKYIRYEITPCNDEGLYGTTVVSPIVLVE